MTTSAESNLPAPGEKPEEVPAGGSHSRLAFEQAAAEGTPGFLAELIDFLKHNKKWWLAPILIALALAAALVMLGGSALAPFIYPIF